ncbi:TPA: ATP-dependent RNA helicase HrpA [Serratia marcescens]|nr:ATP-dependent RNA helicase HrpA [Serratia marcescens]
MLQELNKTGCLYQEDVVDFLIKQNLETHLVENSDGNQVLSKAVLGKFLELTRENVVWVVPDRYWRFRVREDEPGRNARG